MTSEQAIKQLSPAQRRLFEELQKRQHPNDIAKGGVLLTRRQRISAAVLVRIGWVEHDGAGYDAWRRYRLTDLGKLIADTVETVEQRLRESPAKPLLPPNDCDCECCPKCRPNL
jgi:hypothetical protein